MQKVILITGSTDGIGLEAAKMLVSLGHRVLIHGRSMSKLEDAENMLNALSGNANKENAAKKPINSHVESYSADLSDLTQVSALADAIAQKYKKIDVLINNAGVYNTATPRTQEGLDVRFVVNTIVPYLLTKRLLPQLESSGRVINVSSAAQQSVDLAALESKTTLTDGAAYAQSKLALIMWTHQLALSGNQAPVMISVNPGSLLGSKMVKDAFGIDGGDIRIGAEILTRLATEEEFADKTGQYFDNDSGHFAAPHPDALDQEKCAHVVASLARLILNQ